ncbi:MAG: aspartate/glutamate racemase family protein [Ruthenibacterium lactatiformans]
MRILLLNPNSTQMVTQRIQRAAAPYQSAELEITAATAKKAPPAIETAMDELQASIAVLEELEARKGTYDGAALCCFSDPGLDAAKELCDVPVVGMCEAAVYFSAFTAGDFPSWAPVAPATCPICTAT